MAGAVGWAVLVAMAGAEEATVLAPLVVTATRVAQDARTLPLTVDVFDGAELRAGGAATLDDALRRSAAFSLFRRSGSLTANPTAQGVSLRGIGPSGASRALVLLDGLPMNDPFGGWVGWSKFSTSSLERVEIVRGGGSSAWGGSALGGVVQLVSRPLLAEDGTARATEAGGTVTAGDFSTRGAEAGATAGAAGGRDAVRVEGAAFATDGVGLVREPGAIDRAADSRHTRAQAAWARRIGETTTLTTVVRGWEEERGNGTPFQRNASEEAAVSATLAGAPAGAGTGVSGWSVSAYGQRQDFRSRFSAVDAARASERPASDQYAVPATAAGLAAQATWGEGAGLADGEGAVTTLGADARRVEGETREYFFFDGAKFARERRAGGAQTTAGVFSTHARALGGGVTATAGARGDVTRQADGFRRETVRATGAALTDEAYGEREERAFSPGAGLAWRATETLTFRAAGYGAYRTPTLNELYRPFRVGTVTTRANPELEPERLMGAEAGLAYAAREGGSGWRLTIFQNALEDAVGSVTLDATTRERRNLEETRVRGVEAGAWWRPAPGWRLEADYAASDARVRSGGEGAEALDGKRVAQVPRHTVTAGVAWEAAHWLELDARARWVAEQFEDDLNTLALGAALRVDLAVRMAVTPRVRVKLAVENVLNGEVETGRTAGGVVSVAPPRWARAEVEYRW